MIIDGNPGKVNEYPIVILSYLNDETMPIDYIFQPIKSVAPVKLLITFFIGGFVFIFNITDNYHDIKEINDLTISPDNKFTQLHFKKGTAWDFLLKFANIKQP